jgi:hypothetical protein
VKLFTTGCPVTVILNALLLPPAVVICTVLDPGVALLGIAAQTAASVQ